MYTSFSTIDSRSNCKQPSIRRKISEKCINDCISNNSVLPNYSILAPLAALRSGNNIKPRGSMTNEPKFSDTWLNRFMLSNNLSFKTPSSKILKPFSELRKSIVIFTIKYMKLVLTGLYHLSYIINADQTPIPLYIHPRNVIGNVGEKRPVAALPNEKSRVTLMAAVNLIGDQLVPFVVDKSVAKAKQNIYAVYKFREDVNMKNLVKSTRAQVHVSDVTAERQPIDTVSLVSLRSVPIDESLVRASMEEQRSLAVRSATRGAESSTGVTTRNSHTRQPTPVKAKQPKQQRTGQDQPPVAKITLPATGPSAPDEPTNATEFDLMTKQVTSMSAGKRVRYKKDLANLQEFSRNKTVRALLSDSSNARPGNLPPSIAHVEQQDHQDQGTSNDNPADTDNQFEAYYDDVVGSISTKSSYGVSNTARMHKIISDGNYELMTLADLDAVHSELYKQYTAYIDVEMKKPANQQHKRKRLQQVIVTQNANSWFTLDIMKQWVIKVVIPLRDANQHILLILDQFSCHRSDDFLTFCRSVNIDVLLIPPHCTGYSQPLDLTVNRTIKSCFTAYCGDVVFNNHVSNVSDHLKVTDEVLYRFILQATNQVTTPSILNGFSAMTISGRAAPSPLDTTKSTTVKK